MIKRFTLQLTAVLFCTSSFATDFSKADKLANKIPGSSTKTVQAFADYLKNSLNTQEEQVRAAYIWIGKSISYDKNGNVDLVSTCASDSLANVILKKKKGVCTDYAELLHKICLNLGVDCYIVAGYTKRNNTVTDEEHAWNAIHLDDGRWLLFDPMWGAGSLSKGKFTKKQSTEFCGVEPSIFIGTHMPFDPAWQLLMYPISANNFYKNDNQATTQQTFSFADTIVNEEKLLRSEQLEKLCHRLTNTGNINNTTAKMITDCQSAIPILKSKEKYALEYRNVTVFNGVADKINVVITYYNKFISAKKTLKTKKVSISQLKIMMDSCTSNISGAQTILSKLNFEKDEQIKQKNNLSKTILDLQKQLDIELVFLNKQKKQPASKKKKK